MRCADISGTVQKSGTDLSERRSNLVYPQGKKHRRHQIHVNVRNMELPGREAILTIEVGQGELIVKKLIIEEATAD